ncbi:MAG: EAL domain-containing protein [Solirubrobacteraceae bacterium]|jgi:diguanylate cyclase (GGDEF)-like protein
MTETFTSCLPRSAGLTRPQRLALGTALGLLAACLAVTAANAIFGIGGSAAAAPIRDWVSSAVYILVAAIVALRAIRVQAKRLPWALIALGLSLYGLGNVLWSLYFEHLPNPPIPSVCDLLWLSFYPLSYAGIVRLSTSPGEARPPAGVWLDGVIAGMGLAAIGAALIFEPVLDAASGSAIATATELAYPIGDLLLAALVVGVLALRGWRIDRVWSLLGGGFLLMAVADCMYAVQVAGGSSRPSPLTNLAYVLSVGLLAVGSWQMTAERTRATWASWSVLAVPAGFLTAAVGLLLYDHVHRLNALAFALATVTLLSAILRMALAFRDVRGLSEARRLAATDDLTSLPNRRLFMQRVEEAIAAARLTDRRLSVLMLDLDNFKQLNDTLGHQAGDTLLRLIGPRIQRGLRDSDTVARLGGDEFAILLAPSPDEAGVIHVAERILSALREPFEVQGLALPVNGSVGIASFPGHARDTDELMRHADIAMYQAKSGRSGYEFYAHDRDTNSVERLALAGELAVALEDGSIEVFFQPKAVTATQQIVGVEALVRWRRPDGTLVRPDEFIAAAEHAGLSRPLTRRVISLALDQLQEWRARGYDLTVAVNTTVSDLLDMSFPGEVADALAARRLAPHVLVLEVTESSVLSDPARIGTVLCELESFGIEMALDDFGTGYSSLAHLKSLPVAEIKIDRSFVSRMCGDATDVAIVYAMIQLADKLGLRVVAEGVEDEETRFALESLECELIQGYLLSRPVPAQELEPLLAAQFAPPAEVQRQPSPAPSSVQPLPLVPRLEATLPAVRSAA